MQTGQNSIAPENSLPQIGQVRLSSVFMDLTVLPRRLKLREEHGFPRQPGAARLGKEAPGSEPPAIPSSIERCKTRRRHLLASCSAASIVTSRRSKARVSHATAFGIGHSLKIVQLASHRGQCAGATANYRRGSLIESDESP